jgi:hypothetical protein
MSEGSFRQCLESVAQLIREAEEARRLEETLLAVATKVIEESEK